VPGTEGGVGLDELAAEVEEREAGRVLLEDGRLIRSERLQLLLIAVLVLDRGEREVFALVARLVKAECRSVGVDVRRRRADLRQVLERAEPGQRLDQWPPLGRAVRAELTTDEQHLGLAATGQRGVGDRLRDRLRVADP